MKNKTKVLLRTTILLAAILFNAGAIVSYGADYQSNPREKDIAILKTGMRKTQKNMIIHTAKDESL